MLSDGLGGIKQSEGKIKRMRYVGVLSRQTYQRGTRDSRLCDGGSLDLEPEG
jgi:hypothetical protein